jgi:hypothetical protein
MYAYVHLPTCVCVRLLVVHVFERVVEKSRLATHCRTVWIQYPAVGLWSVIVEERGFLVPLPTSFSHNPPVYTASLKPLHSGHSSRAGHQLVTTQQQGREQTDIRSVMMTQARIHAQSLRHYTLLHALRRPCSHTHYTFAYSPMLTHTLQFTQSLPRTHTLSPTHTNLWYCCMTQSRPL